MDWGVFMMPELELGFRKVEIATTYLNQDNGLLDYLNETRTSVQNRYSTIQNSKNRTSDMLTFISHMRDLA